MGKTGFYNDERRKTALLDSIDRVREEFPKLQLFSVEESLTRFEIACFQSFHNMEDSYNCTLAAAIWILDELRRSGKLHDAYEFLPSSRMDIEEMFTPIDFYHPCYEDDLIQSVAHVIYPRNVLTSTREQYVGLLNLMGSEKVKTAAEKYRTLQWKVTELFLRCEEFFDMSNDRRMRELESIHKPSVLVIKMDNEEERSHELVEQGLIMEEDRKRLTACFEDCIGTGERRVMGRRELGKILGDFSIEDPYEICFATNYLVNYQDKAVWSMKSGIAVTSTAGRMLPWYVSPEDWDESEDQWEPMSFDRENDWLEQSEPAEDLKRLYTRGKDGKNLAQRVYRLCKGVMPLGFHPFANERIQMKAEEMPDADLIADQAEVLFLSAFRATAANFRGKHWWDEESDELTEAEDDETDELTDEPVQEPVKIRGLWAKVAEEQGRDFDASILIENPDKHTEPKEGNEKELLERAKKEIKELKRTLATVSREAESDRARYEHELKPLRMEHRELADLRELVFNRELAPDAQVRREKVEKKYSYPYATKKRTVIFGGHDTFLKAIRPMLPEVRFVDPENYSFNPEIVRNADVVWVQTNCISHSQYNNITRVARQHGIQLRYFAYASAEKCAEQLVAWDRKLLM